MDIEHILTLIKDLEIDDPAFESVTFVIDEPPSILGIPTMGAYFPDTGTIVIAPDSNEACVLHELGHRHGHFYSNNLSEGYAEDFRKVYQGNHNPHHSSSLPFYAFCGILGAIAGLGLGIR